MNPRLTPEKLKSYQQSTFCTAHADRIKSPSEAIDFVNRRGFIYFWPITGITMPSLWIAVAGDRPVASAHDDPGHVTWGWKDELLGKGAWYYAKVLRKKATLISMSLAPYFYALSENYGSPEDDYLTLYEQGRMTMEARRVYETILDDGPLDTISIRRKTKLTSRSSDSRFDRAIRDLQADFKILPVGVSQAGGWRYAFIYDLTPRHHPEIVEQARFIQESGAREKLVERYFQSVGAAQIRDVMKLFSWRKTLAEATVESLVQSGVLRHPVDYPGGNSDIYAHNELFQLLS